MVTSALGASLAEAVGRDNIRPGHESDSVGGVSPRFVARPIDAASLGVLLEVVTGEGVAAVASGGRTRLRWGPPPERFDVLVDVSAMTGVVEHAAGDLVVVVQAGTRLDDLQSTLAQAGQRLAVDGHWPGATIGGLVAHGLSGPSRLGFGTLRDLLIGATFVRADGTVAHTGGKVVKNVAGYDLGKLLHGSWGTLGILAEVVFRLHPLPAARRWVSVAAGDPRTTGALVQSVVQSQAVPIAVELERPPGGPDTVVVLLEGPSATIDTRAVTVAARLDAAAATTPGQAVFPARVTDSAPAWWGRLPGDPGCVLLRVTSELAAVPILLQALEEASAAIGFSVHVRGSAGIGSLLVGLPTGAPAHEVSELVTRLRAGSGGWNGSVVVLDGPPDVMKTVDAWGPVAGIELMRRVKERLDPGRLLSPGRFVGGI